ncbi:hypothetical protein [Pantoea sp. MBLJ3]|uniref:hypothetical protein n=1 Tax=Pantoea sp. MBLJ3 TaxID=1562889 RepID=UPI00057F0EC7|nr:hypothetical protein [Pantoea sp. MBLJ3]
MGGAEWIALATLVFGGFTWLISIWAKRKEKSETLEEKVETIENTIALRVQKVDSEIANQSHLAQKIELLISDHKETKERLRKLEIDIVTLKTKMDIYHASKNNTS